MSPQIALHDPVFRAYVIIVLSSLALGGAVLAAVQWRLKKDLGSIWSTYRSWLVMALVAFVFVFAGRIPVIAGVTLLALFAFKELALASGLSRDRCLSGVVGAGIVSVGVVSVLSHSGWLEGGTGWFRLFLLLPVYAIVLILLLPIVRNRARGELSKVSLAIIGFIYIGWMFGHLGWLANSIHAYGFLGFVIFATELSDVAAFTFGRIFGRHPLRSEISPKKTWEGALGALAVAMALPWMLRFSFPFFGTGQLILAGLIIGIGGQLGDLSVSLIKREMGTKDMGRAIPGHGGILDRIDSLIYVAPLFMYLANYGGELR